MGCKFGNGILGALSRSSSGRCSGKTLLITEPASPSKAGCATPAITDVARSCPDAKFPAMFLPTVPTLEATLPTTLLPTLNVPPTDPS